MQGQSADDILGSKKMNYEFLLLVRDKKYVQALTLGRKILSMNSDNPSVQKFCKFIEKNNSEILKMVQRQKQQEQYESMDDDEQQEEQEQGEEVQGQQVENEDNQKSQEEDKQQEDQMEEQEEQQVVDEQKQKREKIQLTTCTLNQIPHICPRHHKELESSI